MKVVCIRNISTDGGGFGHAAVYLTKNKSYEVLNNFLNKDTLVYKIKDDKNNIVYVLTEHFLNLKEFREQQINQILT